MTLDQQFQACAEMDGWTPCVRHERTLGFPPNLNPNKDCPQLYKDYNTYDALIPLIVKWCGEHGWNYFVMALIGPANTKSLYHGQPTQTIALFATKQPSQLREALLKAAGRWKE